jgi:hypothetical protein
MGLVLGGLAFGQSYTMKSGETTPTISIEMYVKATGVAVTGLTITNLYVTYQEYRTAAVSLGADIPTALATLDTAYMNSDGTPAANCMMIEDLAGGYRLDLPPEAVDGGPGTFVKVWCWDAATYAAATNVGYAIIQLTPPVNTTLVNGTTPQESPANFSAFAVEASTGAVTTTATSNTAIAAATWNALVADYSTTGTYGLQVGTGGGMVAPPGDTVAVGIAQGGSTNYITLSASDTATIDYYKGYSIRVMDVTDGFVAVRGISSYDNATKRAYVASNWVSGREPTSGDTYIIAAPALPGGPEGSSSAAILTGIARAGGTGVLSIQLADTSGSNPSTVATTYVDNIITIVSGTGAGQTRAITVYSGHNVTANSDNVCTVDKAWTTTPNATSVYNILPSGTNWLNTTAVTAMGYSAARGFYSTVYATEDAGAVSTASVVYVTHTSGTEDGDFASGAVVAFAGVSGYSRPVYGVVRSYVAATNAMTLWYPLPGAPQDGTFVYPCGNVMTNFWSKLIGMYSGR